MEKRKTGEGYWRKIENTWLVTNRHVLVDEDALASSITFHVRKMDNGFKWHAITLTHDELLKRAKFHTNKEVDVAAVLISELITNILPPVNEEEWLHYHSVSDSQFPGQNKINIEAADDALVIGYPRGFYDTVNLFPIIKSGVIASRWEAHFEGNPYFLIDAKLFPGSSDSIVISKPIGTIIENGQIFESPTKQFAFLGVFSGEPFQRTRPIELETMTIIEKESFNVGIVWYYWLVEEIITQGGCYEDS